MSEWRPLTKGERIRQSYNVPARRGMAVKVEGRPGRITGFRGMYLLVRFDGEHRREPTPCHPTWCVEYLDDEEC